MGMKLPGNTIKVNSDTLETSQPGIFAAGDAAGGPGTVIDSIAAGQKAALSVDRYLRGRPAENISFGMTGTRPIEINIPTDIQKSKRHEMPKLPREENINCFDEPTLGFSERTLVQHNLQLCECGGQKQLRDGW